MDGMLTLTHSFITESTIKGLKIMIFMSFYDRCLHLYHITKSLCVVSPRLKLILSLICLFTIAITTSRKRK